MDCITNLGLDSIVNLGYQCMHCGGIYEDQLNLKNHECVASEEDNKWGRPMVLALLNIFPKEHEKFVKGIHKSVKKVFDATAVKMQELGYQNIDGTKCDQKWRNLKKVYMQNKLKQKTTGSGRIKFTYFKEMDEILGKKPNVSPLATYKSEDSQPSYRDNQADDATAQSCTASSANTIAYPGSSTSYVTPPGSSTSTITSPGSSTSITASPGSSASATSSPAASPPASCTASSSKTGTKRKYVPEWYSQWEKKHTETEKKIQRHKENVEIKRKALSLLEDILHKSS